MTIVDQLKPRIVDHALALVLRAADATVADTQAHASRATGALVESITRTQPVYAEPYVTCEISVGVDYGRYEDEGTGIYGPLNQRIFPKHAKALRFATPVSMLAGKGVVFAKSVAGSPGKHYFTEPMPARWANALQSSAGPP